MSELKIGGLSIMQEKAAQLIVNSKHITDKQISKKLGIKPSMLSQWKKIPQFKLRVLQLIDANIDLERSYRIKHINRYLKPVYKEIKKRLSSENIPLKQLIYMMTTFHNELRQDGNFNRKFLEAGLKDYGEEGFDEVKENEEDIDMGNISDLYEERRKRELEKKKSFSS